MDISGKVLREVEFRDRLRGYDTDEVDEFLEKVAVSIDEVQAELEQLTRRAERAERRAEQAVASPEAAPSASSEPSPGEDAIRRTLVLAQRTADMAIAEAREEATRLLEEARAESDALVGRAQEAARRLRDDAEEDMHRRVSRLGDERERLEREVQTLVRLLEAERSRLTESLSSALRVVGDLLAPSEELSDAHASLAAEREPVFPSSPPADSSGEGEASEDGSDVVSHDEEAEASGAAHPAEQLDPSAGLQEGAEPSSAEAPVPDPADPAAPEAPFSESQQGSHGEAQPWGGTGSPGTLESSGDAPVSGARLLPDVEDEIAEDAATAYGGPPFPGGGPTSASDDSEEALWERWAAGRDLGVVPGPEDFSGNEHRFGRPGGFTA
ncbi:MAG: hypothetical protein JWM85_2502 [Acidimicrobiaceae bacterium]|nr:hypothetical protein [Acidimicrobiaceae bacterium]